MARPRTANVMLPRDVQKVVKPSGKAYYYYAPRRGSPGAGKRMPLGSDTSDPDFWRRLREASTPIAAREGTLSKLIRRIQS
jgi:hypothetical protein